MAATAAMPAPPRYYKAYTNEAVADGTAPEPPKPLDVYNSFGVPRDATVEGTGFRSLEDGGLKTLYDPAKDRLDELRRLNKETVDQFVGLIDLVSTEADGVAAATDRLELLFTNMHHMLNEFRPHQGRETIRAMMERQQHDRGRMIDELTSMYADIKKTLSEQFAVAGQLPTASTADGAAPMEE